MEGTGPIWKLWLFLTPIFEKFATRLKRFRRPECPPPTSALYKRKLSQRIARWPDYFNILHQFALFFLETPNPIRHQFTKENGTSGLWLTPTFWFFFFSPFRKVKPPETTGWHGMYFPLTRQLTHSWTLTNCVFLVGSEVSQSLPVRQSVLHGSRLSWWLNYRQPISSHSLWPKIPPKWSPAEKEQPPNNRAPWLGNQQNPCILFLE